MNKISEYCKARYMLDATAMKHFDGCLKNVNNGLVAPKNVTITEVKSIGKAIVEDMSGKSPVAYSFKKKMQAVPLPPKQPRSKAKNMIVDSNLLFQRILATCSQSPEDLEEAFSFELAIVLQSS